MQDFLYAEISAIGITVLLIILWNQRQNEGSSTLHRQFNRMIYATIAELAIDATGWVINGAVFPYARIVRIIVETLYYFLLILIPYLWVVYVEYALSKEHIITRRRLRLITVSLLLGIVLIVINLFTPIIFTVDQNNIYHRETGFLILTALAYIYLLYATFLTSKAARQAIWPEEKRRYVLMACFIVLPAIGGVIQTFIYGVSLIWIFVTITILLLYIYSLNYQISTDPLTGINNRRELTRFLHREIKDYSGDTILSLIMMDVNRFKQVNDMYGHYYGDTVLIAVADLLKQACCNTSAFLARYGGDEFCIVYPAKNTAAVDNLIAVIQSKVIRWNAENNEPVTLGLSIGYAAWQPDANDSTDALYKRADQQMYLDKNKTRNP